MRWHRQAHRTWRTGTASQRAVGNARRAVARCSKALRELAARDGFAGLRIVEEPGEPFEHGHSGKVKRVIANRAR